ncbi:hypothetical protein CPLU01_14718 [Colletotrichum plurivorum]|uniref:Uncharacterized protein n=1 Tax=Colletotrichum plurivorum TaxID=2175906 RepID=A0A8H6JHS6_9PEZI|nr:hypothetical protein CPLU01_14718 [Colletotrichum plurivorum]
MSSFSARAEPFFEVAAGVPYEADKNCTIDISGTMDSPYARREYLLGDDFTSFWFGGYECNYTNSTTAYWNVWMQDAQYDSKVRAGDKPYKVNMCSQNFTYSEWHDEWAWQVIAWDHCNRTQLRCNGRIPDDTPGGTYVAVAVRDEVGTTSASTASSDEFTIVQSYNPTITPTMKPTSTGPGPGPGWGRAGDGNDGGDETGRPELDGQAVVAAKTCVELDGKPPTMAELENRYHWTSTVVMEA